MSDARLDPYRFKPEEYPVVPGGPYTPWHPMRRRVAYAAIGVSIGILGSLGNALVNVNVAALAGSLGSDTVQANWLVAVAIAANASANLMLIRARFRYGVPAITRAVILFYAGMALLQFAFPGYTAALAIRFASGMAASGLTTLGLYSLLQALPARIRPSALAMAIVLTQFATPIARLFPVELLAQNAWHGLHLIEVAISCLCLVLSSVLPLPPTDRKPGLERLDLVTIALLVPAIFCLCGVLGLGRVVWWTDTPWLGGLLVAFVVLFTAVVLLERSRAEPLIHTAWIGSRDILRFAAVAVLVRLALAEQTFGAVGLLTSGGLTNDQLRTLFLWVLAAMTLGMLTAGLTLSVSRLPYQVMIAAWIIAFGAWLDSDANNLTRPGAVVLQPGLDRIRHLPVHGAGAGIRIRAHARHPATGSVRQFHRAVQPDAEHRRPRRLGDARHDPTIRNARERAGLVGAVGRGRPAGQRRDCRQVRRPSRPPWSIPTCAPRVAAPCSRKPSIVKRRCSPTTSCSAWSRSSACSPDSTWPT